MITFLAPDRLGLLVTLAGAVVAYLAFQKRRRRYSARFTDPDLLEVVAPRRPGWRRHVPPAGALVTAALLVLALAEPVVLRPVDGPGTPVVVAIDVSPSMQARDVRPSRLDAAKAAAVDFVRRLPSRSPVGVVSFAGTARVLLAPTVHRDAAVRAIGRLDFRSETAVGDAILTSVGVLRAASVDPTSPRPGGHLVLLSDGASTTGPSVDGAAAAARGAGVRVSTIAFGTDTGEVVLQGERVAVPPDRPTMRSIARRTSGTYHTATTAGELTRVYRLLAARSGRTLRAVTLAPAFVALALAALFATSAASLLWFGRFP